MKATIFSLVSLLVSLCLFGLLFRSEQAANPCPQINRPTPTPSPQVQVETKPADPNERFRIVPSNFAHVDFKNRSYGLYEFSWRSRISLNLVDGKFEYSEGDGGDWFDFKGVYF